MNTFQVKSAEELAKMDAAALADYMFAKLTHDNEQLKAMIAGKANPDEVAKVRDEIIETHNKTLEQVNTILEAVKQQGLVISRMGAKMMSDDKPETIRGMLVRHKEKLEAVKSGKREEFTMNLKAAGTMTFAANITGEIPQALRIPGFNELPLRPRAFMNFLRTASTDRVQISWVYRANRDGSPAATSEGATKPLIDFDFLVGSETVSKYTDRVVVTMEMLDDIDFMEDAIRSDLLGRLLLQVEADAYSGSGAAGPPKILSGVRTLAPAFAAPSAMAGAIDNPDTLSVLNAAMVQIELNYQPAPTAIFMNPQDVALLREVKVSTTDRRRVESLYIAGVDMAYAGVPIISSNLVTADEFLLGYMPYATLYTKQAPQVTLGFGTGDFENNRVTLLGEWRGAVVVKHNDRPAFVKGAFSTAKAALAVT